jgi:putative tryptophan/tyrosine transport system substrate-binding protein
MDHRGSRPSRRRFVVGAGAMSLGLLAGCGRLVFRVQPDEVPAAKVHRVGFLSLTSREPHHESFWEGLREFGYVEGRNITIEARYAAHQSERLPELAAELVRLPVDVIVAAGTPAAQAAKRVTNTIPIVFANASDPIAEGLAASLARPGGNATGLSNFSGALSAKRLELLKETVPGLSRVAVLANSATAAEQQLEETRHAAQVLGLEPQFFRARPPDELGSAFGNASRERAQAMTILGDPAMHANVAYLAKLAAEHKLPAVFPAREFVVAGGLLAYGPDQSAISRRAAYYVDRILKGAKPADLPVEQPMLFDFMVNMKTARELGITFPKEILLQITEVVE